MDRPMPERFAKIINIQAPSIDDHTQDFLWWGVLEKRPRERTPEECDAIANWLKDIVGIPSVDVEALRQLAACCHLEELDKNVTLFRQGDRGTSWYVVVTGRLEALSTKLNEEMAPVCICPLGPGSTFGESVIDDSLRGATVVTRENCRLLRVEQRDFRMFWEKHRETMAAMVNYRNNHREDRSESFGYNQQSHTQQQQQLDDNFLDRLDSNQQQQQPRSRKHSLAQTSRPPSVAMRRISSHHQLPPTPGGGGLSPGESRSRRTSLQPSPAASPGNSRRSSTVMDSISPNISPAGSRRGSDNITPSGSRRESALMVEISPASSRRSSNQSNASSGGSNPLERLGLVGGDHHHRERKDSWNSFSMDFPHLNRSGPGSRRQSSVPNGDINRRPSSANLIGRESPHYSTLAHQHQQHSSEHVEFITGTPPGTPPKTAGVILNGDTSHHHHQGTTSSSGIGPPYAPSNLTVNSPGQNGQIRRHSHSNTPQQQQQQQQYLGANDQRVRKHSANASVSSNTVQNNQQHAQHNGNHHQFLQMRGNSSPSSTGGPSGKKELTKVASAPSMDLSAAITRQQSQQQQQQQQLTPDLSAPNNKALLEKRSDTSISLPTGTTTIKAVECATPNPASPITDVPSAEVLQAGWLVYRAASISNRNPPLIRDRQYQGGQRMYRHSMVGTEMVDWLLEIGGSTVLSRHLATAMWQVLLEEGIIAHVTAEHPFKDKYLLYKWNIDESSWEGSYGEDALREALAILARIAPDALFRLALRKPRQERSEEDLELIYEELLQVAALSHLSTSVKRQLADVLLFEAHQKAGTILFRQGDVGHSWYIILKGSVNVVIQGRGTVTTLGEGDDFGKLALLNNATRAATIVLREDNCHFLRVDKDDFNRILRDVEANTVRLQEHGKDVLVLERVAETQLNAPTRYSVVAGTPYKMVEHLLQTRLGDGVSELEKGWDDSAQRDFTTSDLFLDDFLLTHIIFMSSSDLAQQLIDHYHHGDKDDHKDLAIKHKRRVVHFVHSWIFTIQEPALEESCVVSLMEDLGKSIRDDGKQLNGLESELTLVTEAEGELRRYNEQWRPSPERPNGGARLWKLPHGAHPVRLFATENTDVDMTTATCMRATDDIIFRVHCADHTYCTLRFPLEAPAGIIKRSAADKLGLKQVQEDLLLVEVKSTGERVVIPDRRTCVPSGLSLNGALFISPKEHLDALTPLQDQMGPGVMEGTSSFLEAVSSQELAYWLTVTDWEAFQCIHPYELLYKVLEGESLSGTPMTGNLDVFIRRTGELQYWAATEICLATNLSKRSALMRKFIKVAAYCQEYGNINGSLAIVSGLANNAITRLTHTWEKLPKGVRKVFAELEGLTDPSRNHRRYRMYIGTLKPPVIPYMPLLLKDMTFAHEGNQTLLDSLVNFEKMHLLAQSLRMLRACRARNWDIPPPPSTKSETEVRAYVTSLRVIDSQRILNQLSQRVEPRR